MAPVTLYTAGTPNGFKASVTLEELGIEYDVHHIDLGKDEQKEEWYLKINPNGRIPAIVDHSNSDLAVFESGALMIYLAEKYGDGSLLPKEGNERYEVLEWLMFQMGGLGPMMGQANHFVHYAPETIPYGQKRYINESKRLLGVLELGLKDGREYLAGGRFTLADIANFCWAIFAFYPGIDLGEFPSVKAWAQRIYARPATRKGLNVPKEFPFADIMEDDAAMKAKIAENKAKISGLE